MLTSRETSCKTDGNKQIYLPYAFVNMPKQFTYIFCSFKRAFGEKNTLKAQCLSGRALSKCIQIRSPWARIKATSRLDILISQFTHWARILVRGIHDFNIGVGKYI